VLRSRLCHTVQGRKGVVGQKDQAAGERQASVTSVWTPRPCPPCQEGLR
jgi:hypothetical protein